MFIWMQLSVSNTQQPLYYSTVSLYNASTIHSIIYHVTSRVSSLAQTFSKRERSFRPDLICTYTPPLHCKQTHIVQCIHTGHNNIRFRDSGEGRFLAVKNMLLSAAHLSLNRIIISWGRLERRVWRSYNVERVWVDVRNRKEDTGNKQE